MLCVYSFFPLSSFFLILHYIKDLIFNQKFTRICTAPKIELSTRATLWITLCMGLSHWLTRENNYHSMVMQYPSMVMQYPILFCNIFFFCNIWSSFVLNYYVFVISSSNLFLCSAKVKRLSLCFLTRRMPRENLVLLMLVNPWHTILIHEVKYLLSTQLALKLI